MDAPAVAVTRDGKKVSAAWMDLRGGGNNRRIYLCRFEGAARPIADIPTGIQGHPSMAFDARGALHIAWEDFRSEVQRIHYRRPDGSEAALSPSRGMASFPSLACGKNVVGVAFEYGDDAVFVAVN